MATILAQFAVHRRDCGDGPRLAHDVLCACDPHRLVVQCSFKVKPRMSMAARIASADAAARRLVLRAWDEVEAAADAS